MKPEILHQSESKEYFFREGCFILELSNTDDDPQLSITRARVEPGCRTRLHKLEDTTERYLILAGTGRVEVGDAPPQAVAKGDVVRIPPGLPQRIENTGRQDLVFLALCTPRFTEKAYIDMGG